MEFARDVLDTPVPEVYAWDSDAQSSAVGAEYIIMQKAPGVQLEKVWTEMQLEDRLEVVKQILRYQKKWISITFRQFGSLYFAHDIGKQNSQDPLYFDEDGTAVKNPRFAVGPSTGREYYDAGRASVQFDRGPCSPAVFLDYEGPPTRGLERPELPDNYDQLDGASQKKAMSLWLSQMLSTMYRLLLRNDAPLLYRTWEYQQTASFELLLIAQRLLIDGEAQYLASILELENIWSDLPGVVAHGSPPYPFHFSSTERTEIEADAKGAAEGMNLMRSVRDSIGRDLFPDRGVVRVDQHDEAKNALQQIKDQVLALYAHNEHERKLWEEDWPFDG